MRRSWKFVGTALVMGGVFEVACSAGGGSQFGDTEVTTGTAAGGATGTSTLSFGQAGSDCVPGGDSDSDGHDEPADCDDCDPQVHPGAIELPTTGNNTPRDENCDGTVDEVVVCDNGLSLTDPDPMNAAKAMEICTVATQGGTDHGVLTATWVTASGQPLGAQFAAQHGLLANFGPNVPTQAGTAMVGISSGFARLPGQPGAAMTESESITQSFTPVTQPPPGFPQDVPNCTGSMDIYDDVALELVLRSPNNATGYRYQFKFYSFEFAEYVCTSFNDQYIALVAPPPMGALNGNISFDSANNPVSVNIAFFDVCDPAANNDFAFNCFMGCPPPPNPYCPSGPAELAGTGFDDDFGTGFEDAGATSWLQTSAPIGAGEEFTIRFAIWDTGDFALDSTVLLDKFEWLGDPDTTVITEPPN